MNWKISKRTGSRLIIILIVTAFALGFCFSPWGRQLDRDTYNLYFQLRGVQPPPPDIVIVAVDESSFAEINRQWPWPRQLHGRLLESLFKAGARTVALDIIFSESSSPEQDQALARIIDKQKHVVLATQVVLVEEKHSRYDFLQRSLVRPTSITKYLKDAALTGHANLPLDADGFVRQIVLQERDGPSLAFQAVQDFLRQPDSPAGPKARTDQHAYLNYVGPSRSIETISYYQALDPAKYLPPDFLKSKLVFVGLSLSAAATPGTGDQLLVPFSSAMSGVEIHATAAHNILRSNFIQPSTLTQILLLGLLFGLGSGIISFRLTPSRSFTVLGLAAVAVCWLSYLLLTHRQIYLSPICILAPIVLCTAMSAAVRYFQIWKERLFIKQAFGTYVSPQLVAQLISQPDRLELGGEEVEGTVIFIDIANFTSFSETLAPPDLTALLNRNLGEFTKIILRWDGTIDKYLGDGLMALWGAPLPQKDHAERACQAVLEILEEARRLAKREQELSGVHLAVRIGVNSGRFVAGNVGGGQRFNYSVLGSEVNLAARLEGINKMYGTDAVVSAATAEQISDAFMLRELDRVRVKGQQTPVTILELQSLRDALNPQQTELNTLFQRGRDLYRAKEWQSALTYFEECLRLDPEDGPSKTFQDRCRQFLKDPPPNDWDGVFRMTTK